MSEDTKFVYGDEVVLVHGFHRGQKGKVTNYYPGDNTYRVAGLGGRYPEEDLEHADSRKQKPVVVIKQENKPSLWSCLCQLLD